MSTQGSRRSLDNRAALDTVVNKRNKLNDLAYPQQGDIMISPDYCDLL